MWCHRWTGFQCNCDVTDEWVPVWLWCHRRMGSSVIVMSQMNGFQCNCDVTDEWVPVWLWCHRRMDSILWQQQKTLSLYQCEWALTTTQFSSSLFGNANESYKWGVITFWCGGVLIQWDLFVKMMTVKCNFICGWWLCIFVKFKEMYKIVSYE